MLLLIASPVGPLLAEYTDAGVYAVRVCPPGEPPPAGTRDEPAPGDAVGRQLVRELAEYFAGCRRTFDVAIASRGTAFQQRVWQALREVPFGATRSYGEIAERVGSGGAARAVGQANARNPVPILVPCHRIRPADGGLGGYLGSDAGSGISVKRWLLDHELMNAD